jgi:hypothetical protein
MGTIRRLGGKWEEGYTGPDHEGRTFGGSDRLNVRYIHAHHSLGPIPQPDQSSMQYTGAEKPAASFARNPILERRHGLLRANRAATEPEQR